MDSEFDRLMTQADESLFAVFGSTWCYTGPMGTPALPQTTICISKNVQIEGADGLFRPVAALAEIRLCEVPKPQGDAQIHNDHERYRLDKRIDSDGLVERWSLLPVR
tara:strand:- start:14936 stop:15256 length:321 start_codon:yes stop_codon:yes gene_type:complete